MEAKFDLILNELREIHGSIRKLDERVEKLDERVGRLEQRVGNLESRQKELFQITRASLNRQEKTDANLECLSMDVHRLHGDVKELKVQFNDIRRDV